MNSEKKTAINLEFCKILHHDFQRKFFNLTFSLNTYLVLHLKLRHLMSITHRLSLTKGNIFYFKRFCYTARGSLKIRISDVTREKSFFLNFILNSKKFSESCPLYD